MAPVPVNFFGCISVSMLNCAKEAVILTLWAELYPAPLAVTAKLPQLGRFRAMHGIRICNGITMQRITEVEGVV